MTALAGRVACGANRLWFWMRDTQPIDGCLLRGSGGVEGGWFREFEENGEGDG